MAGQRNNLLHEIDVSDLEFLQETVKRRLYACGPGLLTREETRELFALAGRLTEIYYDDEMTAAEKKAALEATRRELGEKMP